MALRHMHGENDVLPIFLILFPIKTSKYL